MTTTIHTFFIVIGGLVIRISGLLNQNLPYFWFSGLFASKATFFLQTVERVLKAVWFIHSIKPDHPAKIPPYAPQLAVRFIGGVVVNCNDYNT